MTHCLRSPVPLDANGNVADHFSMTRDPDHLLPSASPVTLISAEGEALDSDVYGMPKSEELVEALGGLMSARRLNDQAYALVRQGRLAVYPSSHGQEACQVAAAQVLDEGDWLFPTYRDTAAVVARGVD